MVNQNSIDLLREAFSSMTKATDQARIAAIALP